MFFIQPNITNVWAHTRVIAGLKYDIWLIQINIEAHTNNTSASVSAHTDVCR